MLETKNLESGYGPLKVVWGVNLRVKRGEIVALLGPNGAGKTTTLRTISGILKPFSGEVWFNSTRIDGLPPYKVSRMGIVYVTEDRRIFPKMTVYENLLAGAYIIKDESVVKDTLELVYQLFPKLRERKNQLAGTLSGGERQMLVLGRALMSRPQLMLLDEPSLGLAPNLVQAIFDTIPRFRDEGVTILLVEQNVYVSLQIADRGYVMEQGRIVLEGSSEELLENEHVKRTYLGI